MNDLADEARPRGRASLLLLALGFSALFAGFVALGSWQLYRLGWKLDLIDRVEQRLSATPVAAPGPGDWSTVGKPDEYRRVKTTGEFLHDRETCVQAVTVRGPGCWVMTPLRTHSVHGAGFVVLVNRGFVEPERRDAATRSTGQIAGPVTVTGLLRLSEPHGGFLRRNDPTIGRWTSRDVAAIAEARQLAPAPVAPYFIDAADSVEGGPVGGLTVVRFHNNHLVYALTWYALAALVVAGAILLFRRERRLHKTSRRFS